MSHAKEPFSEAQKYIPDSDSCLCENILTPKDETKTGIRTAVLLEKPIPECLPKGANGANQISHHQCENEALTARFCGLRDGQLHLPTVTKITCGVQLGYAQNGTSSLLLT